MDGNTLMTCLTRKGNETLLFSLVLTYFLSSFTCDDEWKMSIAATLYDCIICCSYCMCLSSCVCVYVLSCAASHSAVVSHPVSKVGQVHCSCTWRQRSVMEAVALLTTTLRYVTGNFASSPSCYCSAPTHCSL